jgi:histidinol dehydrogenase
MEPIAWSELDEAGRLAALARPAHGARPTLAAEVCAILEDVRRRGWAGLAKHALRLDGRVPERVEVAPLAGAARASLEPKDIAAIELAARSIADFHQAVLPRDIEVETFPGVRLAKTWRPIDRVGLYVPGGSAPLFSTLLMLAIPARAAGVRDIIVTTPPAADGSLAAPLALAAELAGIDAVWTVGGAQAIAAMAFGAGDIPAVDKICGPGNIYVDEAKRQVSQLAGGPAIDLPAGPSELMLIADGAADPASVSADLLSQAEHDAAAQVMLVTTSAALAHKVRTELARQHVLLPRKDIAARSLESARLIMAHSLRQAVDIANIYAPEHLSLNVAEPDALVPLVRNAGALFVGGASAEVFGDYLAGSSHVLPTASAARAWSGVSAMTFMKAMTVQQVSPGAARELAAPAAALARLEGLEAHARAAELRGPKAQGRAA